MAAPLYKVGGRVYLYWEVYDASGAAVAGIDPATFTTLLTKDQADDATVVTCFAVGSGRYGAWLEPASAAHWHLVVRAPAPYTAIRAWRETFVVSADGIATPAEVAAAVWATALNGARTAAGIMRGLYDTLSGGKTSGWVTGLAGTVEIRDAEDTKTRLSWTYDQHGNRLARVTEDLT